MIESMIDISSAPTIATGPSGNWQKCGLGIHFTETFSMIFPFTPVWKKAW